MNKSRIIVSLDFSDPDLAYRHLQRLHPDHCRVKVGKELFTSSGPAFIRKLIKDGYDVFLDLKFHDIPNTVAKACQAAAALGVWMLNVHVAGGREMLRYARDAIDKAPHRPLLIGVTVLTSMSSQDLKETGIQSGTEKQVLRLTRLCREAGLDGVVCSAQEVSVVRREFGKDFCLVTPGIRPAGSAADDQKRTMTPAEAIAAGSDYLVIGRPIIQAPDPLQALLAIEREIGAVQGKPVPVRPAGGVRQDP